MIANGSCCSICKKTSSATSNVNVDAFGRLRVSNPVTLFDSQNRYKLNEKFYSNTLTGGSISYSNSESTVLLTVNSTIGSTARQESRFVFNYQPGKSLLVMNTCVLNPPVSGLVQRVGYFGSDNGYFLQLNNSTLSIVERSNAVDNVINQSAWNGDRLDGSGPSKITINTSASQIFFTDIEWLGVGAVRTGFVIDGNYIVCNTFRHANITARTYMTTACLPVRYEIYNTTNTTGSSTLKQICSTVITEGGYEPKEQLFCVPGPLAGTVLSGTLVPVCSIRLATGRLDAIAILKQVNVAVATNNDLAQWRLILNGTLTGASFGTGTSGSTNIEYDTSASAISGGRIIELGFAQTGAVNTALSSDIFEAHLGRNSFTQTSDVLTLCLVGLSSNPKTFWSLAWSELI